MKADPKCAENFSLLAELLETTLADPIKATKCYTKAVGLDPYDIGSARSLARLLGAAGEFAGLQVTARWLAAASVRWHTLGKSAYSSAAVLQALCEDFLTRSVSDADEKWLHQHLGSAQQKLGDLVGSIVSLQRAVRLD